MSRKGNCWDNACVESFFHSMKVEVIHYEPIMNREPLRQHVFEYTEVDYNPGDGTVLWAMSVPWTTSSKTVLNRVSVFSGADH